MKSEIRIPSDFILHPTFYFCTLLALLAFYTLFI